MNPKEFIQIREQCGLDRNVLADYLGIHVRNIYRYEKGDTIIPAPIAKLMRFLGDGTITC